MSSIQLSSSSYSSNTFGIQSAGAAFIRPFITTNDTYGTLYTQGCNFKETRNCTIACQDPTQIFMSPYTLQNCMVLSMLVPSNWLQPNESTLSLSNWTQPLSTEALEIATEFGIDTRSRDFPSLASNVTRTIRDCLGRYCDTNQNCPTNVAEQESLNASLVAFIPWYLYYTDYAFPSLGNSLLGYNITCPSGGALNPDIGGIGVNHGYAPPMIALQN